MIDLHLFGPPEILYNGKPLNVTRRVTRALLFFIASSQSPVSRAEVMTFFWPDADEETARVNLRESLARLRAALPEPDLILTTPETMALDTGRINVDVLEFLRISEGISWAVWKLPPEGTLSSVLYEAMSRIVTLYSPSGFLAGIDLGFSRELEHWRDTRDTAFRQIAVQFLDRLYTHTLTSNGPGAALRWLDRAVQFDRWNDELNARYLNALLKAAKVTEARKFYHLLEELYRTELEMPLPEEIVGLRNHIFTRTGKTKQLPPTWPLHPTVQSPYVGQQTAFADLRRAFASGGGAVVLGEAGLGKTRFVQEFYRKLVPAPRLLLGVCHDLESNLPFQPWIDLLRRSVQRKEWGKLAAPWVAPMSLILPEMAEIRGDVTVPRTGMEFPRNILFEAVRQTLMILSQEEPLFLFMDDVHWADESSLGLLAYLLEQSFFDSRRGFLVITARIEETNTALDRILLTSFPRRLMRIQLTQLTLDEITELAHHVLSANPPAEFVQRLFQDTGGNPFFVLETLQGLVDPSQRPDLNNVTSLPLAGSIYQLIRRRIQALPQNARDVLMIAAVYANNFEANLMEEVQNLPTAEAVQALEELEKARLIQPGPKGQEHIYMFLHEKIRECVLLEISPAMTRLLNARIAEVIEKNLHGRSGMQAALLASHYENAAMFSKAFDYWVEAAQHAYRLGLSREATQNYERAERLIPRTPVLMDEQIYRLYSTWSDMAFENDASAILERINSTLLQMGWERQSNLLIGNAYDGLSEADMSANRFKEGVEHTNLALQYLQHEKNRFEFLEATIHRGVFAYMLGQIEQSQEWFTKVLELSQDMADDQTILRSRGNARYQMAITETLMGRPVSALQYASQAMDDHMRVNWAYGRVAAFSVTGLANYFLYNFAAGREACLYGLELAERLEGWRMLGYLNAYTSMNELELGNLGGAWTHAHKTIEIGSKYHHAEITGIGFRLVGDIYAYLNAFPQAARAYQQGLAVAGENFIALDNLLRLGAIQALSGQPAGLTMIQQAKDQLTHYGIKSLVTIAAVWQATLFALLGQSDSFEQASGTAEADLLRHSRPMAVNLLEYPRAMLEVRQGKLEEALARLERVLPIYTANELAWYDINAQQLRLIVSNRLGCDISALIEKLQETLLKVELTLGNTPLQPEWDAFFRQTLDPETQFI
jgi:DNA-binding SARP family transcriptional activator/tetratricopeptide (TPR) repeat protein